MKRRNRFCSTEQGADALNQVGVADSKASVGESC